MRKITFKILTRLPTKYIDNGMILNSHPIYLWYRRITLHNEVKFG